MDALQGLNNLIEECIKEGCFPGANYCLVIKDKVYYGSLGDKATIPSVEKNDIDTLYDMASVSKVLSTTSCILKLLEEGKLRLYAKVSNYLPRYKHTNVTIFNLLTHTSGMQEGISKCTTLKNKEETLDRLYSYELNHETGTKISYSDLNYIMLGEIVELLSGMPLNEYAKKILFDPLEMVDTCYKPVDKIRCAPTEIRDDETYRGLVRVSKNADGARNYSQCDSLLLGNECGAHTFPYMDIHNNSAVIEHEATTSKISEEQLFYCNQRGIGTEEAIGLIVNGYAKEVLNKLPMEFAIEAQKLLSVSLEGAVG